jgi:UDP-N-acetylglucosamine--N-acetylmuramyl-(pentapeptide) pyrophosphoryl-undecaprenol N-acetylglucosamine transferase
VAGGTRILFATSNGTGLGHLNRAMAIARRLPAGCEASIFTLSQAAPIVAGAGFDVDYLASYRRAASGTDRSWNLRLRDRLEVLLATRRPDLVVFDGVHPYRALTHVLSASGAPPSVWCRRPMWRAGSAHAPLRRQVAFDAVLEPGELAWSADRGPTVAEREHAVRVGPIVYLDREELLDRAEAARALGLDPARRTVLVNLGQGGGVDGAVARTLRALAGHPQLQVAALQSSIATGIEVPDEVVRLDATFPMSRYFAAFDLAVAAAGYNAFHELIAFGVPTLFVPMGRETDDQPARARWAAHEGVALALEGAADEALERRIEELADPAVAERLRSGARRAWGENGALRSAELIARMASGETIAPPVRRRGRMNRWLRLSSHPIGPTLPLVLALGGRDLLRHPERRAPRLLVLAVGVSGDELAERLESAIPPGMDRRRVLVVTDSLSFAELRRLGVAFELLPAVPVHGRRDLGELRRLIALLTKRRRPLRAVSVGEHGPELLGISGSDPGPAERS